MGRRRSRRGRSRRGGGGKSINLATIAGLAIVGGELVLADHGGGSPAAALKSGQLGTAVGALGANGKWLGSPDGITTVGVPLVFIAIGKKFLPKMRTKLGSYRVSAV